MADRAVFARAILLGLNAVPKCGSPGNVLAFGSTSAFCPLETETGHCPIGAAEYGGGRVVAFGHNGYFLDVNPDYNGDKERKLARLVRNAVIWGARAECEFLLAQGIDHEIACGPHCENTETSFLHGYPFGKPCRLPISIGAIGLTFDKLKKIVQAIGAGSEEKFQAIAAIPTSEPSAIDSFLQNHLDVILWTNSISKLEIASSAHEIDPRAEKLLHFVQQGGALLVAVCPWGWEQLSGGSYLATQCIFNHVLETVGLLYQGDYAWGDVNGMYDVQEALRRVATEPTIADTVKQAAVTLMSRQPLDKSLIRRAVTAIQNCPSSVFGVPGTKRISRTLAPVPQTADISTDMRIIQDVVSTYGGANLKFPLNLQGNVDFARSATILFVPWFNRHWQLLSPQMCPKAPAIDHPGQVSPSIPRLTNFLTTINPWLRGWQTTGVYIPPGEVTYITLSDQAVAAYPNLDLQVRVGCHTDWLQTVRDNDDNYNLERWPFLSTGRNWKPKKVGPPDNLALTGTSPPAESSAIAVAYPYGGLLYIEMFGGYDESKNVPITFSIDGGILAPYYNLQLESAEIPFSSWTNSYPHRQKELWQRAEEFGAPWGEIEGRYMVISMPQDCLRRIKNPQDVATYYDQLVGHELALAGQTLDRKERYVMDKQISAGWLHSGYPVMGHLVDGCKINDHGLPQAADVGEMKRFPPWGIYHELGHNRQRGEWTWTGLTEVTVNIFSLYATHMINGDTPYRSYYFVNNCKEYAIKYLQDPAQDYNKWSSDCNIALATYVILIEQFGWKFFADLFRDYEAMDNSQKPRDDNSKIIEWVRRTSQKANVDLRPFYRQWKWPIDQAQMPELDFLPKYTLDVVQVLQQC